MARPATGRTRLTLLAAFLVGLCNGTAPTSGHPMPAEASSCVEYAMPDPALGRADGFLAPELLPSRSMSPPEDVLRRTVRQASSPPAMSGQASGGISSPSQQLAAFGEQLRNQGAAAVQQAQNLSNQFAASLSSMIDKQTPKRARRQISYPSLPNDSPASAPAVSESPASSMMKYLSNLNQQVQQAQAIQQLVAAVNGSGTPAPTSVWSSFSETVSSLSSPSAAQNASQSSTGASVAQAIGRLGDMFNAARARNARLVEESQRGLESASQQSSEAAKSAQGSIQSALGEIGQGLQRLAANNPNLVPDIKNLYQSVSSKLSSASSSLSSPTAPAVPAAAAGAPASS